KSSGVLQPPVTRPVAAALVTVVHDEHRRLLLWRAGRHDDRLLAMRAVTPAADKSQGGLQPAPTTNTQKRDGITHDASPRDEPTSNKGLRRRIGHAGRLS